MQSRLSVTAEEIEKWWKLVVTALNVVIPRREFSLCGVFVEWTERFYLDWFLLLDHLDAFSGSKIVVLSFKTILGCCVIIVQGCSYFVVGFFRGLEYPFGIFLAFLGLDGDEKVAIVSRDGIYSRYRILRVIELSNVA